MQTPNGYHSRRKGKVCSRPSRFFLLFLARHKINFVLKARRLDPFELWAFLIGSVGKTAAARKLTDGAGEAWRVSETLHSSLLLL